MDYTGLVKAISELHNVPKMDKEYELYYDETNNSRIFRLTDEGFNFNEKAYFLLGGLAFEKGKRPSKESLESLVEKLRVQQNSTEIKFKHIQQKAKVFLELISKKRTKDFIEWLYDNKCWVHYSYRDNFYYSIVDIIDSLEKSSFGGFEFNRELKSTLYDCIAKDKDWFIQLMIYFDYPNVKDHNQFIDEMLKWFERINPDGYDFNIEYLRQSMNSHRKDILIFLEGNKDRVMIENYADIYRNSILTFYNSFHVFDEELEIQKSLDKDTIEVFGKKVSYEFVKSENSIFVQLSDLIIGVLRMWMAFLESHSIFELKELFSNLTIAQKQTTIQFQSLMYNSLLESFGFKHGSGSNQFEEKINYFMEYNF
ncbi:DUF3800 domain-containing protein [Candidatus Enterococcus mansonii]|uniref:DUF3800 domain-containing protein n=1 Tax=Candidatus Enterococcus mansonii TaxID=1834181 RepID=A0A242CF69_9ENTE|nr:DUF3800 domain-containing protein [Enterococcus sp. 4G2_DIV0659]OTO08809.1 hypothetical protein A5880_001809 [Enterococcus sp. 4G2_DIV0659]